MKEYQASCEILTPAQLGEGAIWDDTNHVLYWLDILGKEIHEYDPVTQKDTAYRYPRIITTIVQKRSGGFLVAADDGIYKIESLGQPWEFISNPEGGIATHRYNDGKVDPGGRFWVGTMHLDTKPGESFLFRMDADYHYKMMIDKIDLSNGIVWSRDKTRMFYTDSLSGKIYAYDYENATGDIRNPEVMYTVSPSEGMPDGITIDGQDRLWIALFGGAKVICVDTKTSERVAEVKLPVPNVTSSAFGGKDLSTLYITSARIEMTPEQLEANPMAGSLFSVNVGAKGLPAAVFAG